MVMNFGVSSPDAMLRPIGVQRRSRLADELFLQRDDDGALAVVGRRIRPFEPCRQSRQLGLRLFDAGAFFQSRDHTVVVRRA